MTKHSERFYDFKASFVITFFLEEVIFLGETLSSKSFVLFFEFRWVIELVDFL